MSDQDELMKAQLDLVLLIGQKLNLEPMIKGFLPRAVSILGCVSAGIWIKKPTQTSSMAYHSPVYYHPQLKSHIKTVFPQLSRYICEYSSSLWPETCASKLLSFDGRSFVFIPLGNIGLLVLERKSAFDIDEAQAYRFVFDKLTEACKLCLDYESLFLDHRNNLDSLKQVQKASDTKNNFLAVMSHELRTPLHGILGLTSLTLDSALNELQYNNLKSIKSSAKSLLSIIDEILNISQVGSRALRLKQETFKIKPMLENTLLPFKGEALKKGLDFHLDISSNIDKYVISDSVRLKQIINNLVSNAIKFTNTGSVLFSAQPYDLDANSLGVRFQVSDTGIGIKKESLKNITDPFILADSSQKRKHGGTGLGLAVSRNFIRLFDSDLTIDSELNKGTCVTFSIVFPVPSQEQIDKHTSRRDLKAKRSRCDILLAEDNIVNKLVAEQILDKLGHNVLAVENGRQAVTCWETSKPDVILMDVQMPEMDGLEATRIIRNVEKGSSFRTPIIALTANARQSDQEACMNAGMDYFISKPFSAKKLQEALSEISDMWSC